MTWTARYQSYLSENESDSRSKAGWSSAERNRLRGFNEVQPVGAVGFRPSEGEVFIAQRRAVGPRSGGAQQLVTSWPNESTSRSAGAKQIHLLHFKVEFT
jgi:hypothetical protein